MNSPTTTRRHPALSLCVALATLAGSTGCEVIQSLAQGLEKPSARITGTRLDGLTLDATTLLFDVEISNPYGVDVPILGIEYGLASDGETFLSGESRLDGSVPARASRTVPVSARVPFRELLSVLSGVSPGKVIPWSAELTLAIDPPGTGELSIPLGAHGELPIPAPPSIDVRALRWESLTLSEAKALVVLDVLNTNEFPFELSGLAFDLALGGTDVARSGVERGERFAAGEKRELGVSIAFSPSKLGLAAFNMLRGSGASYRIAGEMTGDTPFGPLALPFERSGRTAFERVTP